jgi:hypothetical protein
MRLTDFMEGKTASDRLFRNLQKQFPHVLMFRSDIRPSENDMFNWVEMNIPFNDVVISAVSFRFRNETDAIQAKLIFSDRLWKRDDN